MNLRLSDIKINESLATVASQVGGFWRTPSWDCLYEPAVDINLSEVATALHHVKPRREVVVCSLRSQQAVPIYPLVTHLQISGLDSAHVMAIGARGFVFTLSTISAEWAMTTLSTELAHLSGLHMLVGASRPFTELTLQAWWNALQQSTEACHRNLYDSASVTMSEGTMISLSREARARIIDHAITAYRERKLEGLFEAVDGLFEQLSSTRIRIEEVAEMVAQLLVAAVAMRPGTTRERLSNIPLSQREWLTYVASTCPKWSEWKSQIKHCLGVVLASADDKMPPAHSVQIRHVIDVIQTDYETELDVTTLAARVFLSASYLSKRFKSETGMTIREFIVQTRIQKAKELLLRDYSLKAYEVGAHVGYADPTYFNKLFKRQVGVTPKTFRDGSSRA